MPTPPTRDHRPEEPTALRSLSTQSLAADPSGVAVPTTPITAKEAAAILGLGYPGAFNNARKALQRAVSVRGTNAVVWVVDAWGGVKWPGCEWRYDAAKCRRAAEGKL